LIFLITLRTIVIHTLLLIAVVKINFLLSTIFYSLSKAAILSDDIFLADHFVNIFRNPIID